MTRSTSPHTSPSLPSRTDKTVWDYVRVLYRRRWVAIPVFLLVFTLNAVNIMRQVPVYESRAQLLIESDAPKMARLDQMFDSTGYYESDSFYQTQYRILQSRTLAKLTIDRLKLWDVPKLGNGPEPPASIDVKSLLRTGFSTAKSFVTDLMSSTKISSPAVRKIDEPEERKLEAEASEAEGPEERAADGGLEGTTADVAGEDTEARAQETAKQSGRIDEFLSGLSIIPVRNSRLVEVRYRSTDPKFAADAANALTQAYIQRDMEDRFSSSKDAADWLGERLAEQRKALAASEAALQSYRERNGTVSVDDSASNIVVQRLTDLNAALTKAKTERINKEALYTQLKGAERTGTLDTVPTVRANDYVQKLRADLADLQREYAQLSQRYGERNPELIKARSAVESADAKLKVELSKAVDAVKNEYDAALSAEQSLQASLDAQKNEALSLNRKGIEFGVLEREVESNKQIYESLMQRTKEMGISSELRANNMRVMDEAEVPRSPASPNVRRELTIWFGASLLLAVGLAFGLEYLDNRVKTPEHVTHDLGLPFLGMLPALSSREWNDTEPLLSEDVPVNFAEAVRAVRTSLLFSTAEEGAKTLVVTSTAPGEGKTLVAANVAIALAQAGQRTILIDGDMRRPRAHELFRLDQTPGLSNVVVGRVPPSAAIKKTHVTGLSVMSAGHAPPNPSELLVSQRFRDLIQALKSQFDWIIIDSPPVMAVTDACVLAHDVTGILFVIGAEMIDRKTASVALDQLEASNGKFVGAVLNRVKLDRHHYYYSHYYRRDYAKHYARAEG